MSNIHSEDEFFKLSYSDLDEIVPSNVLENEKVASKAAFKKSLCDRVIDAQKNKNNRVEPWQNLTRSPSIREPLQESSPENVLDTRARINKRSIIKFRW